MQTRVWVDRVEDSSLFSNSERVGHISIELDEKKCYRFPSLQRQFWQVPNGLSYIKDGVVSDTRLQWHFSLVPRVSL